MIPFYKAENMYQHLVMDTHIFNKSIKRCLGVIKDNPGECLPLERKERSEIGRSTGVFSCICDVLFLPENLKKILHNVKVLSGGKEKAKRYCMRC